MLEGTIGPPFGDSVIVFEGAVHHLALNLEHYGLDPYEDGPLLQNVLRCFDQIACVHMSGLLVALTHERWPRWFPRQGFQTTGGPRRGPLGLSECPASWID